MDLRLAIQLGIIGLTFFMLINASALLVLAERKIMGFMQQRYGPYLTGPHGVLQPLADIIKLLFKEELRPKGADKWLFTLAPILSVTAAFDALQQLVEPVAPLAAGRALAARLVAVEVQQVHRQPHHADAVVHHDQPCGPEQ